MTPTEKQIEAAARAYAYQLEKQRNAVYEAMGKMNLVRSEEDIKASVDRSWRLHCSEMRAALTAALAVEAGAVGVKPLEWKEGDGITCDVLYHTAETPFGLTYWQIECQWGVQGGYVEAYGDEETDEAAKAAAQADYEARVLSALTTSPASSAVAADFVPGLPKLPPYSQSAFPHGFHELWTEKQMKQYARETASYWRNDVVEKAAQIVERYGADHWIASDIRALALQASSAVEGEAVAWCQPNYDGKVHPRKFMVVYEDHDMGNAVFEDEAEAREHFEKASISWNCYLFGLLPRHPAPTPAGEWQCRDHADGWINFPSLAEALAYHRETGAVMRPAAPAPQTEDLA